MGPVEGFEPSIYSLQVSCLTIRLYRLVIVIDPIFNPVKYDLFPLSGLESLHQALSVLSFLWVLLYLVLIAWVINQGSLPGPGLLLVFS